MGAITETGPGVAALVVITVFAVTLVAAVVVNLARYMWRRWRVGKREDQAFRNHIRRLAEKQG